MKYCSHCGRQMPSDARFCGACGAHALEPKEAINSATKQETLSEASAAIESREVGQGLPLQLNIPPTSGMQQGKGLLGEKKKIVIIGSIIALLLVVGCFWCWRSLGSEASVNRKLDLAVKYLSENNFEEAILAYNEAIKIEPKEVKAYQGLARVYTLQGKYNEAKATYDKGMAAVAQDKRQTVQMGLAGMYIDQGQLANAEKAFQEIKNSNKNCLESYWGLAMVYQRQGDNTKAEAMLRQAIEQNPGEYRAYNTLALFLKQNNKADEAFNNLVESLALEINQQEAYLVLSDLYKGRWPLLQDKLATISNKQASDMLGFYSYYAAENYQKVVTSYQEKLSQQTGNQKARVLAAIAMLKTGDKTGAETLINQLSKEKLNEWLLSDLARYYQVAGDKEKAKQTAIKALQFNGTNLDAVAILQNLNSGDASGKIYAAQALLYNWKPVGKVKDEMKALSLPVPEMNSSPSVSAGTQDQSMYGNAPGNLINGGTVCQYGDWIYFANTGDRNRLYRVRTDGTGKQKLADEDPVDCINVKGDWIYYIAGDVDVGGYLYRMRTDGSEKLKLSEELFETICVYGDKLYFVMSFGKGLGCMNTDGSSVQILDKSGGGNIIVTGDWIYYSVSAYNSGRNSYALYRMHREGGDRKKLSSEIESGYIRYIKFIVVGDWIYYVNGNDSNSLYRMHTDGSDVTLVSNQGEWGSLNVNGMWLYSSLGYNKEGIYRIRLDGTGHEKISMEKAGYLNIIQDWIYFMNTTKLGSDSIEHLYRMHLDGSGMELVGEEKVIRYF